MCECASTSVTTIHPRHPPHHCYIIAVSVLDNATHRLQKHWPPPLLSQVLPRFWTNVVTERQLLKPTIDEVTWAGFMMCLTFQSSGLTLTLGELWNYRVEWLLRTLSDILCAHLKSVKCKWTASMQHFSSLINNWRASHYKPHLHACTFFMVRSIDMWWVFGVQCDTEHLSSYRHEDLGIRLSEWINLMIHNRLS